MSARDDKRYVLALDSGTTSVRSVLFDAAGKPVAQASQPLTQHYPEPGWVEHDPREILAKQVSTISEVQYASGIHSDKITAVGIANQRETAVVWDRATGEPVYNAICWQCRRTEPIMADIARSGLAPSIARKTGLVCDPYFSASKIAWILDHVPGARDRAERGELAFGTVDSWLVWNLTGGKVHATDRTNASRTMLYNIRSCAWDPELLDLFGIPASMLPEVLPSIAEYGNVVKDILSTRPPIAGVAGDQQSSLFGHGCFKPGSAKATYGTGCFILLNTGDKPVESSNGLVTTLAATSKKEISYALEGSVFNAGSVVQWLRDEMQLVRTADETEAVARSVPDTCGVYLVPAFTGLGAPWWDASARGMICGLTRASTRAHIVRAALDSIAFQVCDVVEAMRRDAAINLPSLMVDGGGSSNGYTMQRQADLLGIAVERPLVTETTALGAACLAGLGVGFWADEEELMACRDTGARFEPEIGQSQREKECSAWRHALQLCSPTIKETS